MLSGECQELLKLSNYNTRTQGKLTQSRPSLYETLKGCRMRSFPAAERRDRAKLGARRGHRASDKPFNPRQNIKQLPGDWQPSGGASTYLMSLLQSLREGGASPAPSPSQNKRQILLPSAIWPLTSKQEEPWSRRLVQRNYDASTDFQQLHEEFINSSHTHVELSEQQVLNSRVTLPLPFLDYEFNTISKHLSFLIPTNAFRRLHQVLLLEKIKAFLQLSAWR